MFVDVNFGSATRATTGAQSMTSVPRAAVQLIGAKQVVFVETAQPGVFVQRAVQAGPESNGFAPIYAGLNAGECVVTEGSFLLRAERLKLSPAQLTAPAKTVAFDSLAPQASAPTGKPRTSGVHCAERKGLSTRQHLVVRRHPGAADFRAANRSHLRH